MKKFVYKPRVHGNAFVQLPLQNGNRVHIWSEDLPQAEVVDISIHNHRYSFKSKILYAAIENLILDVHKVLPEPTQPIYYHLYKVDYNSKYGITPNVPKSTVLKISDEQFTYEITSSNIHHVNSTYNFQAGLFHQINPLDSLVVTLVNKYFILPTEIMAAICLCPANSIPDNNFDKIKSVNENIIWNVIDKVIRKLKLTCIEDLEKIIII